MQMSISVGGITIRLEHSHTERLIEDESKKARDPLHEWVIPVAIRGVCKALEMIANNTADAHDHLIGKLKKQSM